MDDGLQSRGGRDLRGVLISISFEVKYGSSASEGIVLGIDLDRGLVCGGIAEQCAFNTVNCAFTMPQCNAHLSYRLPTHRLTM